jgi:hypothetical protein
MQGPPQTTSTRSLGERVRRLLMNAVAVVLLYGNAAVALQPPQVRDRWPHLPCPDFVIDAFLMTGMFNSYSLSNIDLFIAGERTQTGSIAGRGQWVQLPVREHFVQRQGVSFTQLFSAHEWDMHGVAAQQRSWVFLARRIREHHNRLHPDRTVARVGFGSFEWPQSPLSYRAKKHAPWVSTQPWFLEPEKP